MNTFLKYLNGFLFITIQCAIAQVDLQCNGRDMHSIYLVSSNGIFRIDSVDSSPGNEIQVDYSINFKGISINNNLDLMNGQKTMYIVDYAGMYSYWNGSGWTYTGHSSGSVSAINPGGTDSYIFNFHDNETDLYRYDGTSSVLLLSSISGGHSIHDVATDVAGNFYLFFTTNQNIIAYNAMGITIDTLTTTGFPTGINCGLTIIGNRVYAVTCNGNYELYEGIKSGNNINFTLIKTLMFQYIDIASCPDAAEPLAVFKNPEMPHFTIYPVPVRQTASVRMYHTDLIEIIDCLGIMIKKIETTGLTNYELDVSGLKRGVYFIKAISKNGEYAQSKFIVEGK